MHPGASAINDTKLNDKDLMTSNDNDIHPIYNTIQSDAPGCIPTNNFPRHKNIRTSFHNYSGGEYFITICTKEKHHYFGKITNGKMFFSKLGQYAHSAMETLATHYSYVEVPLFVIMPNHVHAIIMIRQRTDAPGCIPTIRTALSVVVGGYKQSVTMFARRNGIIFEWQPRYHDHIIRGVADGNKIADYIENNIIHWDTDCFNK